MQLTSNLSAAYEAALGDIMDVVLTGVIDRNIETVGSGENAKRYATDSVRKLYFRGTPEIDAGGRFAADAVPEYLVFDKANMAADFIRIIEEGMEKSKTNFAVKSKPIVTPTPEPAEEVEADMTYEVEVEADTDDTPPFDADDTVDKSAVMDEIRKAFKVADAATKKAVKTILTEKGDGMLSEALDIDVLMEIKDVLS